jgi:hypothetical protein
MEAEFCIEALEEALTNRGRPEIFNPDQGSQFTSTAFTDVLLKASVTISMDGTDQLCCAVLRLQTAGICFLLAALTFDSARPRESVISTRPDLIPTRQSSGGQRLLEVARGYALQVEDRDQHLEALRSARIGNLA